MINLEFLDASFVVLICFLLFMFLVIKLGYRKSISALDAQIAGIKNTLLDAEGRFNQAKEHLAIEKNAKVQLALDIQKLLEEAQHHIEVLKKQTEEDTVNLIESRQEIVDQMIDQMRLKTINDLKFILADQIEEVLKDIMLNHTDKKTNESINQDCIELLTQTMKAEEESRMASAQRNTRGSSEVLSSKTLEIQGNRA